MSSDAFLNDYLTSDGVGGLLQCSRPPQTVELSLGSFTTVVRVASMGIAMLSIVTKTVHVSWGQLSIQLDEGAQGKHTSVERTSQRVLGRGGGRRTT